MSDLDRIRWHCRRGLLELDLVLAGFMQDTFPVLTAAERATFVQLLDADDNDLWDWISGRGQPQDEAASSIVERLRAVRPAGRRVA